MGVAFVVRSIPVHSSLFSLFAPDQNVYNMHLHCGKFSNLIVLWRTYNFLTTMGCFSRLLNPIHITEYFIDLIAMFIVYWQEFYQMSVTKYSWYSVWYSISIDNLSIITISYVGSIYKCITLFNLKMPMNLGLSFTRKYRDNILWTHPFCFSTQFTWNFFVVL